MSMFFSRLLAPRFICKHLRATQAHTLRIWPSLISDLRKLEPRTAPRYPMQRHQSSTSCAPLHKLTLISMKDVRQADFKIRTQSEIFAQCFKRELCSGSLGRAGVACRRSLIYEWIITTSITFNVHARAFRLHLKPEVRCHTTAMLQVTIGYYIMRVAWDQHDSLSFTKTLSIEETLWLSTWNNNR